MIKKLTFSVVLFTMFILTSSSANAADYLGLANNSHISDNMSYLKGLTPNTDVPEVAQDSTSSTSSEQANAPQAESTPVPSPASKAKLVRTNPIATYVVMASAYSSTPDQTDSTPFITAWGTQVRDGIIAANFLPFGTLVKMPDLYGDKIFVVEDRMNRRYTYKIDVWFPERAQAMEFGNKRVKIEVVATL